MIDSELTIAAGGDRQRSADSVEKTSLVSRAKKYASEIEILAFSRCLVDYVGTNAKHLRRMAVVQERAHYQDPGFMERLRQVNQERQ